MLPSPVGVICTPLCNGKASTWREVPITVSFWNELAAADVE